MSQRALLIVVSSEERTAWAEEIAAAAGESQITLLVGTPAQAAEQIAVQQLNPSHILLDIGMRGQDVLGEVDLLAQQCEAGTRVLATGDTNDIILYRGLLARGVVDYLPMPVATADVLRTLFAASAAAAKPATESAPALIPQAQRESRIITFLSAASGDGASVAALNTAYALSQLSGPTILIDMDYQFGMVAKHLNLQNQYGIGDLFDHPDRELDSLLIERMVANYGKLHVITAPADLRFMPTVSTEAIQALIDLLKQHYENIIIDLPHVWVPWISSVLRGSTHVVLVSQLWLKSVSHAARMARIFREIGVPHNAVQLVINRSGARFKEGIDPKDFERVCGSPIRYTLANDIKTITNAEAAARTVMEMGASDLSNDIMTMVRGLAGLSASDTSAPGSGRGLFARLKG